MPTDDQRWKLDGVDLGAFKGLSAERISRLKHVASVAGVECFTTPDCPPGTLELWDGGKRVAVITGIATPAHPVPADVAAARRI